MGTSSAMSTSNQYIKYKITITQNSQSVTGNTSNVTVSVKFYRTNTGYTTYGTGTVYCKINGTTYSASVTPSQKITNSGIVLFTRTMNIAHNADGTKTLTCSAWISHNAVTSNEQSYSQKLTTIPRKSTLDISNGTLGTLQEFDINTAASSFTHTLTYKCGTASGTILNKSSYTLGVEWTPPLSLASQNTAGTSVSVTFTLTTYSGSTSLGSNTYTRSYSIPASVKPSCSIQVLDSTTYKDTYGNLVQGLSRLYVKVTPTLAYSSPIASYSTDVSGAKYTAAEFTTPVLASAGTVTVSSTVKDKRGRTSSAASASFPVIAYNPPVVSALTVHRCNADGSENDQGDYIQATFSAAVTPLNNKNSAAYKLRYKQTTATSFTETTFTELAGVYTVNNKAFIFAADGNSSYDVEVIATDDIKSISRATSASTAFTLMDYKADGTAVAYGKVSEKSDTLENALALNQLGNRYTLSTPGVAGTAGFIRMATIEIIAANADTPITFIFSSRQTQATMTVHVSLRNSTATESSVGTIKYEGTNYDAYLSPDDDVTWGLYVKKGSNYDTITLQDWYTSNTMMSRVRVTFPGTLVDQVPTPYYKATPAMLDSILDYIYPVGSVYISYSHNNPATMFGGTWVRIENAFLWGCDADGGIGTTGGEKTHKLTVNELPSHSHAVEVARNVSGSITLDKSLAAYVNRNDTTSYVGSITSNATGGGAAHNNMPPYVQVSIWRRTA